LDTYEKNVDKALNAVDKVGKAANHVQIGCITILANLFAGFCLWGVYAGYTSWKLEQRGERTTGTWFGLKKATAAKAGVVFIHRSLNLVPIVKPIRLKGEYIEV
jgi:hypothetical protein